MIDFMPLAQQCAPKVETVVMAGIVHTESDFNPYAIGVVGGAIKQPRNLPEAQSAVRLLISQGRNFSVGLSQVNKINFETYGLTINNMFDPCTNLKAGSDIFKKCFDRAERTYGNKYSYDGKLRLAASCYYSGNFKTGFKVDFVGQPPYVDKVYNNILKYRGSAFNALTRQPSKPVVLQPPIPSQPNAVNNIEPNVTVPTNVQSIVKPQEQENVGMSKPAQPKKPIVDNVVININQQPFKASVVNSTDSEKDAQTKAEAEKSKPVVVWDIFQDFN